MLYRKGCLSTLRTREMGEVCARDHRGTDRSASAKPPANERNKRHRDLPDVALTDADLPYIEPKAKGKNGKKQR